MRGDDKKKTDFHWASFLLLNSLQTTHTTVVCTQETAPTPPAALQATALDAPRLLQPTPWPTNCLLCRYFLKWRARHLSDQRSRLRFLEIGVQMSIGFNQLTREKMNCIFFLEVNAIFTYPYQVATLIVLICTEISPSINRPIHCNHIA